MELGFHPGCKSEIRDSYMWYENQSPGLGARFITELEQALKVILEHPTAWPKQREIFHRYILKRFPYRIFYAMEKGSIMIYAVAHNSRRPFYWADRHSQTN